MYVHRRDKSKNFKDARHSDSNWSKPHGVADSQEAGAMPPATARTKPEFSSGGLSTPCPLPLRGGRSRAGRRLLLPGVHPWYQSQGKAFPQNDPLN